MMRPLFFFILFFVTVVHAAEIELFFDWGWHSKGQDAFPLSEGSPYEELSIQTLIRRKLLQQGDDIRSWELATYRPWLLDWKSVKNWDDYKHYRGYDRSRSFALSLRARHERELPFPLKI